MVSLLTAIAVAMIAMATGIVMMIGFVTIGAMMIGAVMISIAMSRAVMTGVMIGIMMTGAVMTGAIIGAVMIGVVRSRAVMIGATMIGTAMTRAAMRVAGAMGATALLLPLLMCAARYARFMVTPPVTAGGIMVMILMMKWIAMSKRCMPLLMALTPSGTLIPVLQTTLLEL
jgi:hypothetical protein